MSGNVSSPTQTVLDERTRSFVRRSLSAGLLEIDDLKKVVASLMAQSDILTPNRLADGLVGAGVLTRWQANKLLAGKCRGFFLGSYRLLRPLGKGGMGVVYLGEHHVMKRLMALKILPPEASQDQRRIDRFKAEARACAQLDHPNIVRAYDFSEAGGKLYIVMEYVDGIDLQYAVQRDGRMSPGEAIDVLTQAASGLAHAHDRGIIHRDIKPSNLLLRTDGVVKVSDLGLARIGWAGDGEEQRLMGTADFLAPEQAINCNAADTRSDIYSLGCTLFYLLIGQVPFDGSSAQRLAKHQTSPPPEIRSIRSDCPVAVAEIAKRMMAKRPEDRPKSAGELLSQLQRLSSTIDSPRTRLQNVAPAGDTVVDGAFYQATLDDTSLSSDGEVRIVDQVEEFDFGNLPPIDVSPLGKFVDLKPVSTLGGTQGGMKQKTAKFTSTARGAGETNPQQVLLGFGLAVAVMTLIAVLGYGVYLFARPIPTITPTIKSTEAGGTVVFIRE